MVQVFYANLKFTIIILSFNLWALCEFYYIIGKSNLMDAISFVLGESTKNLRVKRLNV